MLTNHLSDLAPSLPRPSIVVNLRKPKVENRKSILQKSSAMRSSSNVSSTIGRMSKPLASGQPISSPSLLRKLGLLMVALSATFSWGQVPVDSQLKNALQPLLVRHRGQVALAIRNVNDGTHYAYNENVVMPTASLIKLPLMVAAYRRVDAKQLDLLSPVKLTAQDKVPGSGILTDHFSDDVTLPLRDYVRLMIRYSDNTATNIVAQQVGLETTARVMEELGYAETKLHSKVYRRDTTIFPERSQKYGLGSTTAREMVDLLCQLEQNRLASAPSTTAMKEHLFACEDQSKLAAKLPSTMRFAHKTGAIANCRTDAGLLYTEQGPVAICWLTNQNKDQSWSDQNEAQQMAARIGQVIAERFGNPPSDDRLQEGAFGELVEALQRTLNRRLLPSPKLSIDGDFGPATRAAVERFQRGNKLTVSGIVTKETWQALER